jgi:hypothetical protein
MHNGCFLCNPLNGDSIAAVEVCAKHQGLRWSATRRSSTIHETARGIVRLHNVVLTDNFQYGVNALAGVTTLSSGTNRIAGNASGDLSSTTSLQSWAGN